MRKVLTILFAMGALFLCVNVYCQCNTNELFQVKHGMTKFQSINILNLNDNVINIEDIRNYWRHPDHLNGDSIYFSQVNFRIKSHNCVKSNENIVLLSFEDHRLTKITLRIWFEPENLNNCLLNYNLILESLKKEFPFYERTSITNPETNEQIGEGYWLFDSLESKKEMLIKVKIDYCLEYEMKWNSNTKESYKTGKIDRYSLDISFYE